jgi:hypothetical protein
VPVSEFGTESRGFVFRIDFIEDATGVVEAESWSLRAGSDKRSSSTDLEDHAGDDPSAGRAADFAAV